MKNEYGMELDRNGYAESIMQQNTNVCYLCKVPTHGKLDRHEPWGAANRQKSKALGLWVCLDHLGCHEGPGSVHDDGQLARRLREDAQRAAMLRYGWTREKWIAEFGKSELSEEECNRPLTPAKTGEIIKATKAEPDWQRCHDMIARLFPNHVNIDLTAHSGFRVLEDAPLMPF